MSALFLDALKCKNKDSRPPVWLMRQAGRYMREYRAIREKHGFLDMVHTPELAAEVTLLPTKLLEVDAAILFSDILVLLEPMGFSLRFDDGVGPIIDNPLQGPSCLQRLVRPDFRHSLAFVQKAIQHVLPQLKVPLIGFSGAPFTLASYMIEGRTSKELRKTKQWMLQEPASFHQLLKTIAEHAIDYLHLQIDAGVQAIQIFDSWANALAYPQFREFSHRYLKMIVDALRPKGIPLILFCRGSSVFGSDLAEIAPSGISLDWNCNLAAMRRKIAAGIAIQGNLDPDVLYAPHSVIKKEAEYLLDSMRGDPGYIFNLGHGILPDTPFDSVKCLIETVKSLE